MASHMRKTICIVRNHMTSPIDCFRNNLMKQLECRAFIFYIFRVALSHFLRRGCWIFLDLPYWIINVVIVLLYCSLQLFCGLTMSFMVLLLVSDGIASWAVSPYCLPSLCQETIMCNIFVVLHAAAEPSLSLSNSLLWVLGYQKMHLCPIWPTIIITLIDVVTIFRYWRITRHLTVALCATENERLWYTRVFPKMQIKM